MWGELLLLLLLLLRGIGGLGSAACSSGHRLLLLLCIRIAAIGCLGGLLSIALLLRDLAGLDVALAVVDGGVQGSGCEFLDYAAAAAAAHAY